MNHCSCHWDSAGGLPVLRFPALAQAGPFVHAVFTRSGGVSRGAFSSLNMGANVGDAPENVAENRLRAMRALGAESLALVRQVHGDRVLVIKKGDAVPSGVWATGEEADAVATDAPGLLCGVKVADCQPILLADPVNRAAAACHSGWRGSVADVAASTVSAMEKAFGSRPRDLVACVGPSLGPCCAEFVNFRSELPEAFWEYEAGEARFDFWAISRAQLAAAGLLPENIHVAGLCTRCDGEDFFSYRRDRNTGRCMAVIGVAK